MIYELHVRGYTRHPDAGVSEAARGTFAGVVEKIPYLRELGVTIVELMPVFQFDPAAGHWAVIGCVRTRMPHAAATALAMAAPKGTAAGSPTPVGAVTPSSVNTTSIAVGASWNRAIG